MRTIGLAIGLVTVLALRPAAGQTNLVVNGDFEGGFHAEEHAAPHYNIANYWNWYAFPINSTQAGGADKGDQQQGLDNSSCQRLIIQNATGESFMWQVIDTVPGHKYKFEASWILQPACGTSDCKGNPMFPWIGAFFLDGGSKTAGVADPSGDLTQAYWQANYDLVKSFLPDTGFNSPFRDAAAVRSTLCSHHEDYPQQQANRSRVRVPRFL